MDVSVNNVNRAPNDLSNQHANSAYDSRKTIVAIVNRVLPDR